MIAAIKRINVKKLALALSLAALISPAIACGPFFDDAVFSYRSHPDAPLKLFAQGNLGVLNPTYARSYLVLAYRNLNAKPLTATELSQAIDLLHFRLGFASDPNLPIDDSGTQLDNWLKARKKVAGVKEVKLNSYDTYRNIEGDDYVTYLNCNSDSFATAVKTLDGLIAKEGAASAPVREWLTAQDQVFSHCPGPGYNYELKKSNPEPAFPAALPVTATKAARADRSYQMAAAKFYAGDFDVARHLFSEIAKDTDSPWHKIADYMVARTFIREGTLSKDKTVGHASLQKALAHLDALAAKPEYSDFKDSIDGLRHFILIRLSTHDTFKKLTNSLTEPGHAKNFGTAVGDYTFILDKFFGESPEDPADKHEITDANEAKLVHEDEMSDWIWNFSTAKGDSNALAHARSMYQSKKSLHWLLSLASKIEPSDSQAAEIKAALMAVPESSCAYTTARYHLVRLALGSGKKDEARNLIDAVLARPSVPPSAQAAFRTLKVHTAKNVGDLVKLSFIAPAAVVGGDNATETPENFFEIEKGLKFAQEKPLLLPASAQFINNKLTSPAFVEAAQVTTYNKSDFAQAAFARSVILSDFVQADKALTLLRASMPASAKMLTGFESATPEDKTFMAAYFILKNPGARPFVRAALPRDTAYGQIDDFQDNWWGNDTASSDKPLDLPFGESESKNGVSKIKALGTAPDYLGRIVLDYAAKHPGDKRVPEALHLVVKATHLGATDKVTSKISADAFKLLHTRFKASPWTVKTPYHY